jgi:transketolase
VSLIVEAGQRLVELGRSVRLVSFPSWELFAEQDQAYQDSVILPEVRARVAVEAGVAQGWQQWVGEQGRILAIDRFGASAPGEVVFKMFGFTPERVAELALEALAVSQPVGK